MLNALLNEMDGLKQDAEILFVLTTNRPEQLERALAGRPGRIDQAIEVPLPDEIGRRKLVQLYGRDLPLGDAIVDEAARRTEGVSAAFIKELMRRIAQASIARDGGATVEIRRYRRSAGRYAVRGRQAQRSAAGRGERDGRRIAIGPRTIGTRRSPFGVRTAVLVQQHFDLLATRHGLSGARPCHRNSRSRRSEPRGLQRILSVGERRREAADKSIAGAGRLHHLAGRGRMRYGSNDLLHEAAHHALRA